MKCDINDLYFGIKRFGFNSKKLETYNLFANMRVLSSIAIYVIRKDKDDIIMDDPLMFCFGDTMGRCEYEMAIAPLFTQELEKYDVYNMYVKPNESLLMEMVNKVSKTSAKKWLKEHRR